MIMRTAANLIEVECIQCGKLTIGTKRTKWCSNECMCAYRTSQRNVKPGAVEGKDYVTCPICNSKAAQISHKHAKMHGFKNQKDMQQQLGIEVTCESKKLKTSGENNPGYQHNGKFSVWSENFIHGYDEVKHEEFKQQQSERMKTSDTNVFGINYWLKETAGDEELAKQLHSKSQTRDLNWFVNKWGEEEGKKRHQAKTEKWLNTLNSKSEEELNEINSKKVRKSACFFSKAEKELLRELQGILGDDVRGSLSLCRNSAEQRKKFFVYDIHYKNKIIEYNGDFWHANPALYGSDFVCPYTDRTQDQIFENDNNKKIIAETHGYQVKTVWERDYKSNPDAVIKECLEFLNAK
jgi:hypothetical protein